MKRIVIGLLVLALAAALAADSLAGGCVVRTRTYYPTYSYAPTYDYAPAYVAPVVATTYIPVYVPTYVATYGNSTDQQTMQSLVQAVQQLQKQVQAFGQPDGQVQPFQRGGNGQLPQQQMQQPQQLPPPDTQKGAANGTNMQGAALLVQRCAACHDAGTAQTKGKGVTFTQGGKLGAIDDRLAFRISRELYSGRMPQGAKMTDEEVGQIFAYLDGINK